MAASVTFTISASSSCTPPYAVSATLARPSARFPASSAEAASCAASSSFLLLQKRSAESAVDLSRDGDEQRLMHAVRWLSAGSVLALHNLLNCCLSADKLMSADPNPYPMHARHCHFQCTARRHCWLVACSDTNHLLLHARLIHLCGAERPICISFRPRPEHLIVVQFCGFLTCAWYH